MTSSANNLPAATLEWINSFAPYGVVTTDREIRICSWNQWMATHSGLKLEQVIGRGLTEIFPDLIERRLEGQLQRGLTGEVSVLSTSLHGHLFPMTPVSRDTGYPLMRQTARIAPLVSNNEIQGIIIVVEDVTQREWQAQILRQQVARDEILSWALAHLFKSDDPRRVSRELFCKVAAHLDFDAYFLSLIEPDGKAFRLCAAGGLTPEAEASIQSLEKANIPGVETWGEDQALIRQYTEIQNDPKFAIARSLGFHAYILLPLVSANNLLGFLSFATRSRETIARSEAELLGTIAQYLAVALNREKTGRELRAAQKKLNEHAQELEEKVIQRTASLKQIIAELQSFSYTVAHDLRAPIRAFKGYADVLLEDYAAEMPAEAIAIAGKLREAAIRMDVLTRDLLEFSKVSRQDVQLEPVRMGDIVSGVLMALGKSASEAVTVQGSLPIVLAQKTLAHQCVANLIENALKFVPEGTKPKITIRAERVSSASLPSDTELLSRSRFTAFDSEPISSNSDTRVRIWVEDEGIGIPSEARNKIFGIFERAVANDQFDGTGIGLAIVARAMERMEGACGVESEPGRGSRFWLEFRCVPDAESLEAGKRGE